ncbi:MAG: hypothetical protein Ct9H300mP18_08260 [Candidatus Neomarinimicrobiota bacterium]|nr:MAG: hypothetical protein Ct9H300mP18_08260 [Candidatus Neomarinimicrobiota bacterium]
MHVQPSGDDPGSFYVDDFHMTGGDPATNGRLVFQGFGKNCIPDFSKTTC